MKVIDIIVGYLRDNGRPYTTTFTTNGYLFNNIISNDKELKILNGLYHKLLDELIKDDIISEISKWMEKRC